MENVAKNYAGDVWEEALEIISGSIDEESFATWLQPIRFKSLSNTNVVISVPNPLFQQWIEANYRALIKSSLDEALGREVDVVFEVEEDNRVEKSIEDAVEQSKELNAPEVKPFFFSQGLNKKYTFDNYVVGESNRFANAAAIAVSDPESKAYNPLFIYGDTGLGKTHLMQAIGHGLLMKSPNAVVRYHTSEQFTNSFIDSIEKKTLFDFRSYYRSVDLLLIDDIQFLAGKDRTQIEFFHTFNALHDAGKKIVVTSDCPPKELSALEDRLRSRFEWGLIVDIQQPDIETRMAILRKKIMQDGLDLPSSSVSYIAERVRTSVRALEGVLQRLKIYQITYKKKITLDVIKKVVGHLMVDEKDIGVDIEMVQEAVCDYFDIKLNDLIGDCRLKKFSMPRHIAQYLCRQLTSKSLPEIGLKFKGRDHSSVLHACKKIEKEAKEDPTLQNLIHYLTKKIKEKS